MARELVHTVWLGLRIGHPADWEPARLVLDPSHGRCVLVNRADERLDVQWRPSKAAPDLARMFAHYSRSVKAADREELVAPPGWHGFVRRDGKKTVIQAGRYFEEACRLVELVLVWPGARDRAMERRILSAMSAEPVDSPRRTWQALGLSVTVPQELTMSGYKALPGHMRFRFRHKQGRLTVSRIGLVEQWLKQPVVDWLASEAAGWRRDDAGQIDVNGHEAWQLLTSRLVAGLGRLVARRKWMHQTAWVCPTDGRLYRAVWEYRSWHPRTAPELEIGCCEPMWKDTDF